MRAAVIAAVALLMTAPAVALTGCETLGISATADEKALLAVERGFAATLLTVNAAVDSGQLNGQRAADASALLTKAKLQVDNARLLYDTGQILQANAATTQAQSTLDALAALTR